MPRTKKSERDEVTVSWKGGERTYTREIHGDDFEKLAEQFAEKFGGRLV